MTAVAREPWIFGIIAFKARSHHGPHRSGQVPDAKRGGAGSWIAARPAGRVKDEGSLRGHAQFLSLL